MQIIRKCMLLSFTILCMWNMIGCTIGQGDSLESQEQQQEYVEITKDELPRPEISQEILIEEEADMDSEILPNEENEMRKFQKIEMVNYIKASTMSKKVLKRLGKESVKTVYTKKYQVAAREVLDNYKQKQNYDFESPLFVLDPFGTIQNGLYLYYNSEEPCNVNYTIYVDNDAIPEFNGTIQRNELLDTEHEGLIVGIMPGLKNYVTIEETDAFGDVLKTKTVCIDLEGMDVNSQVLFQEERYDVTEVTGQSMYLLLTDETAKHPSVRLVDQAGVKRLELGLNVSTNLDVEVIDHFMVYPKDSNTLVVVNMLGEVEHFISLGEYQYKSELKYNKATDQIYMIATHTEDENKADLILAVDLESEETVVVLDSYEAITKEVGLTVEFDSFDFYDDWNLLVNSKNISSIFCINLEEVNDMNISYRKIRYGTKRQ